MPDNSGMDPNRGRLIELGFKKATGTGLTPEEEKEYQRLRQEAAAAAAAAGTNT